LYFSHARTALKCSLSIYRFGDGDRILVPDFVCDALIQPLHDLGIIPVYYPTDDQLRPLWDDLDQIVNLQQCHAIVMLHYFGQPQKISQFQSFCKLNNLLLIEDNAHGFGGKLDGKTLGTFGDIGIVSPRKILNTRYGGQLYIKGVLQPAPKFLAKNSQQLLYWAIKSFFSKRPLIRNRIFKILGRKPDMHDAFSLKETKIDDSRSDWFSSWIIDKAIRNDYTDWIAEKRRLKWIAVNCVVLKLGGIPVFTNVSEQSSPWAYPFYVNSKEQKEVIHNQLTDAGYVIFPWPALPNKILTGENHANVLIRWHRLLCVSL